jgi:hypothetical protein
MRTHLSPDCAKGPGIPQLWDCALTWTAPPSRGSLVLELVAALLPGIVDSYAPGPKAPPRIRQTIEPVEGGAVQKRLAQPRSGAPLIIRSGRLRIAPEIDR